jgi:hypothetical protein
MNHLNTDLGIPRRLKSAKVVLGRGLINAQPYPDRRSLNESEVVRRQLIVARCNPATMLDLVEEPFDQITGSIEIRAEANRSLRLHLGGILASAPFLAARALIQSAS